PRQTPAAGESELQRDRVRKLRRSRFDCTHLVRRVLIAALMLIRFTRLTNERHRFEIVRDDGTREAHDLETRSTLAHDLTHYAVEIEVGLRGAFYGRLASGMK